MNIFFGLVLLLVCVYIGYDLSLKYVKRKKFYNEFFSFNELLISNVNFSNQTIVKLIKDNTDKKDDFSLNAKSFFLEKNEKINSNVLQDAEKEDLLSYFKMIGTSDTKSQAKYLEDYKDKLKIKQNDSIEEEKKYKSFYIKLGFLFGLILFIILL